MQRNSANIISNYSFGFWIMIKLQRINYDTIILGGTLQALMHSYTEGIPLIMVNAQVPFYKDIDPSGLNKSAIWRRLAFHLSYAGLNPVEQKAASYRLEQDNIVSIMGKTPYKVEFGYNNIIRYDEIQPTEKLRVFDYFKVINMRAEHQKILKSINTGEDFVNHFVDKIDGILSNIATVSYLTEEQIKNEAYSEVHARLKATEVLKMNDITGFRETRKDRNHKKYHYIKTKTIKREVMFDRAEEEDKLLMQRTDTKNPNLIKISDLFGTPYAD